MGRRLPVGVRFVEVPCGGSIASRHLLAAFESGVDGVMVCPCHNGNCRSDNGCRLAHQRADSVRQLLIAAGVNGERLRLVPLAANMDAEFAAAVDAFATDIQKRDNA
jgi:coenzyme F420-reducing hydrogenase delta subunit